MKTLTLALTGSALLSVALAARFDKPPALPPLAPDPSGYAAQHTSRLAPPHSALTHSARPSDALNAVIRQYCVICHNDALKTGGVSFAAIDVARADQQAETVERMIRKLRAGMMPPPGMPRPAGDTLRLLVEALEDRIDQAAAHSPQPSSRVFQRLNRAEYANSVRALLALDVDVNAFLPAETMSNNFDNIAEMQLPSATLLEGYLRAADYVSRVAVGALDAGPGSTTYKVPRTASQLERAEGAPFGTRGGVSVIHNFIADGAYVFQVMLHSAPEGELYGRTALNEQIEVSIDGERVALLDIDRWMTESDPMGMTLVTDSIPVRAGPRRVTVAFLRRFEGPVDDLLAPVDHTLADTHIGLAYGVTTLPHLRDLAIVGPFGATGVSETPSRRKIFTCRPTAPEEAAPCAERILSRLAAQAYRRPLEGHDGEGLMAFYQQGAAAGGFEAGVRTALQAMLASPHFVFRLEPAPENARAGQLYRIDDQALASRLSFFLWAAPPDQALVDLARRGRLSNARELERQVRRMLDDPRAEALATRFAAQWLRLQDLEKVHPDALSFPYFDHTLAAAMRRETELFFDHLVREDRSVLELLTADYTFVNERLARHYGIPDVSGTGFRRVSYPDARRQGLFGHGSVLTLTSHADRTSPVLRGKWVMEVLLGAPPPPPPPNVPDLDATAGVAEGRALTTRERMEQHRSNPACQSCHKMMDPIGLALDNFDVTGRWRIKENGAPVDTRGELFDGTPVSSPADLRTALLKRPEAIVRNFTVNLMAYGLGRRVEYSDMPTVRAIARAAERQDYRLSAFILGVVQSPAFRMSRMPEGPGVAGPGEPK